MSGEDVLTILGVSIEFFALVVTIITALIPIILYIRTRKKRSLSYDIVSRIPLLSIDKEIGKDLQIFYKEKRVQQMHLIEVNIINSGNVAIKANDFEGKISLNFGNKAQIFTSEITKTNPSNLNPTIKINNNTLFLEPLLLNSGDSISIKSLVENFSEILVQGRVVDIKQITETFKLKRYNNCVKLFIIGGYACIAFQVISFLFWFDIFAFFSITIIGMFLFLTALYYNKKGKKPKSKNK